MCHSGREEPQPPQSDGSSVPASTRQPALGCPAEPHTLSVCRTQRRAPDGPVSRVRSTSSFGAQDGAEPAGSGQGRGLPGLRCTGGRGGLGPIPKLQGDTVQPSGSMKRTECRPVLGGPWRWPRDKATGSKQWWWWWGCGFTPWPERRQCPDQAGEGGEEKRGISGTTCGPSLDPHRTQAATSDTQVMLPCTSFRKVRYTFSSCKTAK